MCAKYHSDGNMAAMSLAGLKAFLSIVPKKVHTLATQFYCVKIIKQSVRFLNPGETPIDSCDQPVNDFN